MPGPSDRLSQHGTMRKVAVISLFGAPGRRMDTWILSSDTQEKAVLHILWYVQYSGKASIAHTA
eukprot:1679017-Prymnesium_polylepis.1